MKKTEFFISAFLVAMFIHQHVLKPEKITGTVIYRSLDANGNEVYADTAFQRRTNTEAKP